MENSETPQNTKLALYRKEVEGKSTEELLQWALSTFSVNNVALASSFGAEDQVLTHLLAATNPKAQVFSLDTGRLPQATHEVIGKTMAAYALNFEILFPDAKRLFRMVKEHGTNLFHDSVESRKLCCKVRKVDALNQKLETLSLWITGLRRAQSQTRTETEVLEWDEAHGLFKLNPLVEWSEEQVWNFIKENEVPFNTLHDANYPSIGCEPCTRAVQPGEDIRAGRWWWETPEQKECGLHWDNGKLVRGK